MAQVVRHPALRDAYGALNKGDLLGAIDAAIAALPEERRTSELYGSGVAEAETGEVSRVEEWLECIRY